MIESFTVPSSNKKKPSLNMFHMGGDEVNFQCWFDEKSIRDWMIQNHFEVNPSVSPEGYLKLWAIFQERALKKLVSANNGKDFQDGILLWTSELTRPDKIYKYESSSYDMPYFLFALKNIKYNNILNTLKIYGSKSRVNVISHAIRLRKSH